jgi:hypothetical protein
MALTIEANYSKKVGLPGYSSHQFSLSLKAEITDLNQVPAEAGRLYRLLQDGVDSSIREIGWLPASNNGNSNGNGHGNVHGSNGHRTNGNGIGNGNGDHWECTPKQRDLILKIVDEQQLDKNAIEQLAQDRYGKGVRKLNKLEASALIEELFERHSRPNSNGSTRQPQPAR